MKQLALLLAGLAVSFGAAAQSGTALGSDLAASSSVATTVIAVAAPLVMFGAILIAAENSDSGATPAPSPSATTP